MRTIRIYTPEPLAVNQDTVLPASAGNHLLRVLRQKAGAAVTLFNGDNNEYAAVVVDPDPRRARLRVEACMPADRESPLQLHLLAGISKGERMDYTVQKAVELGVSSIQPVFCDATVVRLDADKRERRRLHWQEVAIAACEQCGRNRVPPVRTPAALRDALAPARDGLCVVLRGGAPGRLGEVRPRADTVNLLIGPEGGLNEREIAAAESAGFIPLRLGPRILRTETAGLAALAAMQALWGDW